MGVDLPDVREGQEEIGQNWKNEKISQGFEGEFLPFVLEW